MTDPSTHPDHGPDEPGNGPVDSGGEDRPSGRGLGLVLGVVVTAVVLAGAGLGVFFLLSGNTAESDARSTSERFAELYQHELEADGDGTLPADFESVVCADDMGSVRQDVSAPPMEEPVQPSAVRIVVKDLRVEGDRGTVTLTAEISLPDGQTHGVDETLDLVTENGGWRVCGLHRVREEPGPAP